MSKEPKRVTGLELACRAVADKPLAVFVAACDGNRTLGVFMRDLVQWIATTKSNLEITKRRHGGEWAVQVWVACTREHWINKRRPWGKKAAPIKTGTFTDMLTLGRKLDVLRKSKGHSVFTGGFTAPAALFVAPTDELFDKLGYYEGQIAKVYQPILRTHSGLTSGVTPHLHPESCPDSSPESRPDSCTDNCIDSSNGNEELQIGAHANACERQDRPTDSKTREEAPTAPVLPGREEREELDPPGSAHPPIAVPMQIDAGSVTPKHLHAVWAEGCLKHHDMIVLPMTGKTGKQFKHVLAAFQGVGIHPLEALGGLVESWWKFSDTAEYDAGLKVSPATPCLNFLVAHRDVAVNFAIKLIERAKRKSAKPAVQSVDTGATPKKPELSYAAKQRASDVARLKYELAAAQKRLDQCRSYHDPEGVDGMDMSEGIRNWGAEVAALEQKLAALDIDRQPVFEEAQPRVPDTEAPLPGAKILPFPAKAA